MDSVSVATTFKDTLAEKGIIFCSISEAIQNHPELVKKYLGTVIPKKDNYYAALNSAVFSDGSFCYIPKGVKCPMELSTYFRINEQNSGQFERTLIIVEDDSYLDYHRYIDVAGLRMFVLPEVGDEFIYKVGEVYYLMLQEGEYIDQDIRNSYLQTVKNDFVFQKIGYEGPERYGLDSDPPGIDCCPGKGYDDNQTDFIWEYPDASADEQIGEVVEHLLHTVTGVAFALEFKEWDWENPNSEIVLAMNEAIRKK